jgi:tRNA pseudouridine13 synthase
VRVLTAEEAEGTSIFDVVMPMPGASIEYPGHAIKELYHKQMAKDGIDFEMLQNSIKEYTLAGDYRTLMARAIGLEYNVITYYDPKATLQLTDMDLLKGHDDSYLQANLKQGSEEEVEQRALRIQFTLQTSQYATMCLRELMKEHMEAATQGMTPQASPPAPPSGSDQSAPDPTQVSAPAAAAPLGDSKE